VATATSAEAYVPTHAGLDDLRSAVNGCHGCDLYQGASQAVFSSGSLRSRIVMVGETPGDIEDRKGAPFVGPAGALLRRAMAEVGIRRDQVYLTNAVKHFKFHLEGKRRIHDRPLRSEIVACRPWLEAELALLRPRVVVALGATAAQSMAGPSFRVTRNRGELLDWPEVAEPSFADSAAPARFLATVHPSAVLRAEDRDAAYADFIADLTTAAAAMR
jgi:DNA polymerase